MSEPPVPPETSNDIKEQITSKLRDLFPAFVIELAQPYAATIGRMALAEATALKELIDAERLAEARKAIRHNMTNDDLVEEKKMLTESSGLMADKQNSRLNLGREIGLAVLRAAFFLAIGMV